MRKKAFTLVELLIVISILGIMAAIVLPTFQSHLQKTREVAAKDSLRILRTAIEAYAAQHNGVPPGQFLDGDGSANAAVRMFENQLITVTNRLGQYANPGTPGYPLGPYLPKIPENPFTGINDTNVLGDGAQFPAQPLEPPAPPFAWIYQPSTKKVKLNYPGNDSQGIPYFDY